MKVFPAKVFPVKVEAGTVLVRLPPKTQLESLLATKLYTLGQEEPNSCAACAEPQEEASVT